MPVFTTPVSSQNTATSGGVSGYPQIGSIKQFTVISDEFNRPTLNPTNLMPFYTLANGAGTGTAAIASALNQVQVTTTNTTNDNSTLRTSGIGFARASHFIDNRTSLVLDIVFSLGSATSEKVFVGFINSDTPISALPTTAIHMGIYLDTSVSNNLILSSANGSAQVTTDTGSAIVANQLYRLNISWTGTQSAVITLYTSVSGTGLNDLTLLVKQQTVSALATGIALAFEIQWFIQTLTTATRQLSCQEWQVSATWNIYYF